MTFMVKKVAQALLPVFRGIFEQFQKPLFSFSKIARLTAQAGVPVLLASAAHAQLPDEPLAIERGVPQFVFDTHLVDNHWAIHYKRQSVRKVHHSLVKHPDNPFEIFAEDNPSYVWVVKDGDLFRMYYQANFKVREDSEKGRKYHTEVAYAESKDGIHWTKPDLDLFPNKTWAGETNNIVIGFPDRPDLESCSPVVLEGLPEADRRGYRHIVLYRVKGRGAGDLSGIHLVGTRDGVHFDVENDTRIAHLHSDHHNSISYDPIAKDYVMYCRAKQMYRAFGDEMIDTGASRRIATMRSPELWGDWLEHDVPRTLLIPDATDDETNRHFFYGMPTIHRHGIFWGFLEPFRMNDFIHTELATSRDGEIWQRLPERPKLIEYGEDGTWDDTMIFGSPGWVETGDEWYFYYTGWDGPHGTSERSGSVGLASCKRERLISLRGPVGGGVVATRTLIWPGGDLWLNAAPVAGAKGEPEISIRISNSKRRVLENFDHPESTLSGDDDTRRIVRWSSGKSAAALEGQTIRIEIFLKNADLFSFGSTPE